MDKNTIIGIVLMVAVVIGFSYYSRPSEAEIQARRTQDSIEAVNREKAEAAIQAAETAEMNRQLAAAMDSTTQFYAHRQGEARPIVLQNECVRLTLNTKGGTVEKAELKQYKNQEGGMVTLFDGNDAQMRFLIDGKQENLITSELFFTPLQVTDSTVTMRATTASGGYLDLDYKLLQGSYMVNLNIRATGLANFFPASAKSLNVEWNELARQQEKGYDFENRYATLTYKVKDEGTDYLSESSAKTEEVEQPLDWVAFKNQFFSCVMIAHQDFTGAHLSSTPQQKASGYLKRYTAEMKTFFDPTGVTATNMQLLYAPNNYHLLQDINDQSASQKELDLEDLVYLGWPLFKWINRFFIIYVFDWLSSWGLSMGVVLLLLTIVVKVLVYPTTRKSYLSSAKMRVLKPKIDELAAKYPNPEDAMRKQQETMQLYSQYGVSPMGGCLPMLIQMPIWIALFNFVPNAIELRGESFLWANDLSAYDDVISWSKPIWLIGDHLSIFCLLFCLTNIVNTWISMRQQQNSMTGEQAQQMKMMQYMMYIMPVVFFFMFNNYSSGLNYYYFLSGLTSILIMWYLRKTTDDKKLLAKLEANYQANKANPAKKMSGLAARLEAMQKQQQAILEEQKRRKAQDKR